MTRYPMRRKLLVAPTTPQAQSMLEALDLSRDEWSAIGFGAALTGHQFDKMVIVLPDELTVPVKDQMQHLRTRLAPAGSIHFF